MRPTTLIGASLIAASLAGLGACAGPGLAPGQSFPVFFRNGATTLDAPARSVVAQAAEWSARYPDEAVAVTAFTESPASTDTAYRCGQAVVAALEAQGVAPGRIRFGATADKLMLGAGVQDRRVTITVHE